MRQDGPGKGRGATRRQRPRLVGRYWIPYFLWLFSTCHVENMSVSLAKVWLKLGEALFLNARGHVVHVQDIRCLLPLP